MEILPAFFVFFVVPNLVPFTGCGRCRTGWFLGLRKLR